MKRVIFMLAVALVLSVSALGVYIAGGHDHHGKSKPESSKITSAVCPVMLSDIKNVKKAAGKSVYKGETYYFCCKGCKPEFDKNPERYVK